MHNFRYRLETAYYSVEVEKLARETLTNDYVARGET